jgi:hypothetical protein
MPLRQVHHTVLVIALFGTLLSFITAPEQAVASTPTCAQGGPCLHGDIGPGGGRVFYVAPNDGTFTQLAAIGSMCSTDCKYLEAAPNGWSGGGTDPGVTWSTGANRSIQVTDASGEGIGTGYQNSVAIVNQSGNLAATSAAVTARAYTGGSKSDWFLPSKDELVELTSIIFDEGEFEQLFGYPPPPMLPASNQEEILQRLMFVADHPAAAEDIGRGAKEWFNQYNGVGLAKKWLDLLARPSDTKTAAQE